MRQETGVVDGRSTEFDVCGDGEVCVVVGASTAMVATSLGEVKAAGAPPERLFSHDR
jgi:hypothetical protein